MRVFFPPAWLRACPVTLGGVPADAEPPGETRAAHGSHSQTPFPPPPRGREGAAFTQKAVPSEPTPGPQEALPATWAQERLLPVLRHR